MVVAKVASWKRRNIASLQDHIALPMPSFGGKVFSYDCISRYPLTLFFSRLLGSLYPLFLLQFTATLLPPAPSAFLAAIVVTLFLISNR